MLTGLVVVWLAAIAVLWVARPRDVPLGEAVRVVPDVARLLRSLLSDASVPLGARVALVGLVLWLANPIDLVPEFVPVLGPLDDIVVAVLVLRYVRGRVGAEELRRRWPGSPEGYALLESVLGRQR